MNEKVAIAFDEQSKEILNNIFPELRNAAVNIAVKMLAKDPMYSKYFCIECDDNQNDLTDISEIDDNNANRATAAQPAASANKVVSWDEF